MARLRLQERKISPISAIFFVLFLTQYNPAVDSISCSAGNSELLRQRKLDTLKANILAQLGFIDLPPAPNATEEETVTENPQNEAVREAFHVLMNASKSLDAAREKQCGSRDFYAKPVSSFTGIMSPEGEQRSINSVK